MTNETIIGIYALNESSSSSFERDNIFVLNIIELVKEFELEFQEFIYQQRIN